MRLSGSNLTNRGLIDGAETIDGLTSAPVIAARSRLDLGATTIENREHALLFSAGDLAIGGALDGTHIAIGQAGALNNTSASIEALGNLGIDAAQINNTNAHFSTQVVDLGSTSITEYQGNGAATRYLDDTPGVWIYNDESDHLHTPEGNYSRWTAYRYTRSTTETQALSSDTGNLTSYWRHHRDGRDNTGSSTIAYAPPATPVPGDPSRPVARIVEAPAVSSPGTSGPALLIRTITPNITLPDNHLFHRPPTLPPITSSKPTHALPTTAAGSVRTTCCNNSISTPPLPRNVSATVFTNNACCANSSPSSPGAAFWTATPATKRSIRP